MPRRPKGSGRESATKNTFNPSSGPHEGKHPEPSSGSRTRGGFEQDVKRRTGQFTGAGEAPLMKK